MQPLRVISPLPSFISQHAFPPPFLPPFHIRLHSGVIVRCSGPPLQLAIHLGRGRETAPDLSHFRKGAIHVDTTSCCVPLEGHTAET